MQRTIAQVTLRTLLFAGLHSLLATEWMKGQVEAALGRRVRDGLYRFLYNNITFISVALLVWSFSRLPDRTLYRVPRPWSLLMRLVQGLGLLLILDTNRRMGIGRFTGMQGAWEFFSGKEPEREPPGQGPRLEEHDRTATGGAFRVSRHPNNLGPTLLVVFQPVMGVRWLTFAVVGSLYSFLGSILEERRVRSAYGDRYDDYKRRVPFFFPVRLGERDGRKSRAASL